MAGYYNRLGSGPAPGWCDLGGKGGEGRKNIFGGTIKFICVRLRRGAQEVYSSVDLNKV